MKTAKSDNKDAQSVTELSKEETERKKQEFVSAVNAISALNELHRLDNENGTLPNNSEHTSGDKNNNKVLGFFNKKLRGSIKRKKKKDVPVPSEPVVASQGDKGNTNSQNTIEEENKIESSNRESKSDQLSAPFVKHDDIFPNLNDTFLAENGLETPPTSAAADVLLKG